MPVDDAAMGVHDFGPGRSQRPGRTQRAHAETDQHDRDDHLEAVGGALGHVHANEREPAAGDKQRQRVSESPRQPETRALQRVRSPVTIVEIATR